MLGQLGDRESLGAFDGEAVIHVTEEDAGVRFSCRLGSYVAIDPVSSHHSKGILTFQVLK